MRCCTSPCEQAAACSSNTARSALKPRACMHAWPLPGSGAAAGRCCRAPRSSANTVLLAGKRAQSIHPSTHWLSSVIHRPVLTGASPNGAPLEGLMNMRVMSSGWFVGTSVVLAAACAAGGVGHLARRRTVRVVNAQIVYKSDCCCCWGTLTAQLVRPPGICWLHNHGGDTSRRASCVRHVAPAPPRAASDTCCLLPLPLPLPPCCFRTACDALISWWRCFA